MVDYVWYEQYDNIHYSKSVILLCPLLSGKWVDYQRQQYWKRLNGTKVSLNEERIAKLESIGFEWRLRHAAPVPIHTMDLNSVVGLTNLKVDEEESFASVFVEHEPKSDGQTLNDYKWNCHLEEMSRYKELFGTTTIKNKKHPVYGERLTSLNKWSNHQRREYKKRMKGEKGGLSDSKTKRLEGIGFDFQPSSGGRTVAFRGWDEKLNMLKAFQQKYGNCRVPTRKKKSENDPNYDPEMKKLAKWVEHQRSLYWKRAKGEKTSLSDARIAALNAIGFEWRLIGRQPIRSVVSGQAGMKTEEGSVSNVDDAAGLSAEQPAVDSMVPQPLEPASVDANDHVEV